MAFWQKRCTCVNQKDLKTLTFPIMFVDFVKQAPRAYFQRFSYYLEDLGFISSKADYSLSTYHMHGVSIILLVYVDDILITGNNDVFLQHLIVALKKLFTMKDLGCLNYFLGIEAVTIRARSHIILSSLD